MGQYPQSLSVLLAPRAAAHAVTQSQWHRLGQQDRHSPRSLASKFSCALGNRSRLDPVCSRRNNPETEKCSQQTGRAMKGRHRSSGEIQAGAWRQLCSSPTFLLGSEPSHPPAMHQLKSSEPFWELL